MNKSEQRVHARKCLEILIADYGVSPKALDAFDIDEVCCTFSNTNEKASSLMPIVFVSEIDEAVESFEEYLGACVYHCFVQDENLFMYFVGCDDSLWDRDIELLKTKKIRVASYDLTLGILPLFLLGIKEILC